MGVFAHRDRSGRHWVVAGTSRQCGRALLSMLVVFGLLTACGGDDDAAPTATPPPAATPAPAASPADLAAIKQYALTKAGEMQTGSSQLAGFAGDYYDRVAAAQFDYQAAFDVDPAAMRALLESARESWIAASTAYEQNEGIVAGVPALSYYDVWIDAGPSGEDDPTGALDWQLELPNGEVLDKPGNFFHNLTEPAIWGTDDAFVALRIDLDGDGQVELGEVLPEANRFKAASEGLDGATAEMTRAIQDWQPSLEDAFTALVVMIPTMNEYFEQWKNSVFVAGEEGAGEVAFVALSRLFDINGILSGLELAYDQLSPAVAAQDAALDGQIQQGFDDLVPYVGDLYAQEQAGTHFTPEQADLFGTEAQDRATRLTGFVTQAAALLNIQIAE
jgi:hypothetical protein